MTVPPIARALPAAAAAVLLVLGAVLLWRWTEPDPIPASTPEPGAVSVSSEAEAEASEAEAGPGPPVVSVLQDWDAARSDAYAAGDRRALADLYLPGTRVGAADDRLLSSYLRRGLRVRDLEVQLLSVEVIRSSDDEMLLRVVDRISAGRVEGAGVRQALPQDRPTAHRVRLVRSGARWVLADPRG